MTLHRPVLALAACAALVAAAGPIVAFAADKTAAAASAGYSVGDKLAPAQSEISVDLPDAFKE